MCRHDRISHRRVIVHIEGIAAIVTGGSSGLGAAAAARLSASGAKVTIFDLDASAGIAKAREIGGRFAPVDVTDEAGVATSIDEAESAYGPARILVNCAGVGPPAKVIDRGGSALALAHFNRTIAVNLSGTFNVLSKFAARLAASEPDGEERGVIINTASIAAFDGQIGQPAYAASKGGVVSMTLPIAREFARYGIRVMTIAPGLFRTPILDGVPQEALEALAKQVPFPPRLGRPEEYALLVEAIVINPMLNGEVIRLDGAVRMPAK
jgi:NAD(P)-dependent dehydrogenase (short-subunit alcohol dehydrogenase family)